MTANSYLARRDWERMRLVYECLGLLPGCWTRRLILAGRANVAGIGLSVNSGSELNPHGAELRQSQGLTKIN